MAMVRNGDYKGQQAAALKLHRTFKQDKYLFWAIMSLALQVWICERNQEMGRDTHREREDVWD